MLHKFLVCLAVALVLHSPVGFATVTFRILTDADMTSPVFAGRSTGQTGDIFWQGGSNDLDLIDLPEINEATIGQNTVGSSSITFAQFGPSTVASYAVGETVYAGPIVFGVNSIKSLTRQIETLTFTDGLDPETQTVLGLQTALFNADNTFSYTRLESQNSTHEFSAATRHGYFLTAGQDPAVVFADAARFANVDPLITQQGVIDQFNFIINNIARSDWQILTVELVDFMATQKPDADSTLGDFDGVVFGTTFVSFDPDAAPKARSLVSAVLPASRSVQVGSPATFFAVMTNAGTSPATGCRVSPSIGPLGAFEYSRTDPATNAIVGSADTPFDLAAGGTQTLLLAVTPNAELAATDVPLDYRCATGNPAASVVGVNTLLLSASAAPVADIVGLTTVVDLVAPQETTSLFAVASVNVGVTDTVTLTLDTGGVPLPLNLSLCQTDPATGACSSAIEDEIALSYGAGESATFAIFVEPTDEIIANPNAHRIFIRFSDSTGNVRGATTTAVRTQ